MERPTEKILEMAVTEFNWAEVQVRISLPFMKETVTTAQLIDDKKLDVLMNLDMPEHLRMADGPQAMVALKEWESKNQEARDFIDWFAKGIAFDLMHFIKKELVKRRIG